MNDQEKMHAQALDNPGDPEIAQLQLACREERLYDFNYTRPRQQMLRHDMFAEIGADCYIEPPLHSNFGGKHVHFGEHVYANFNLTLVDDTHIYVSSRTMFCPNVTIATADHPILPASRTQARLPIQRPSTYRYQLLDRRRQHRHQEFA